MATAKRKPTTPVAWADIPYEQMSPAQQLGYDVQTERPDLEPSVRRILEAELSDEGKLGAMERFQIALTTPGDPNRDPRHAISAES